MKFGREQRYRCTSSLVPRLPLLRAHNVSLSGQRSYATLCARRRESLGTRLVYSIATYIMCVCVCVCVCVYDVCVCVCVWYSRERERRGRRRTMVGLLTQPPQAAAAAGGGVREDGGSPVERNSHRSLAGSWEYW